MNWMPSDYVCRGAMLEWIGHKRKPRNLAKNIRIGIFGDYISNEDYFGYLVTDGSGFKHYWRMRHDEWENCGDYIP
jgi:hypothetical protein